MPNFAEKFLARRRAILQNSELSDLGKLNSLKAAFSEAESEYNQLSKANRERSAEIKKAAEALDPGKAPKRELPKFPLADEDYGLTDFERKAAPALASVAAMMAERRAADRMVSTATVLQGSALQAKLEEIATLERFGESALLLALPQIIAQQQARYESERTAILQTPGQDEQTLASRLGEIADRYIRDRIALDTWVNRQVEAIAKRETTKAQQDFIDKQRQAEAEILMKTGDIALESMIINGNWNDIQGLVNLESGLERGNDQ